MDNPDFVSEMVSLANIDTYVCVENPNEPSCPVICLAIIIHLAFSQFS